MRRLLRSVVAAVGVSGVLLAGTGPASAEPVVLPVPTIQVARDLPGPVALASKSGRYVISGGALYDRKVGRTLKRFSGKVVSISDDGRYVTYIVNGPSGRKLPLFSEMQRVVKVYDRKTRRTRTATTTSSGRALKPSWRTPCTRENGLCDDGARIGRAPQLQGGAMSGNGRYVVFCANYVKPNRIDLYIKDWRTKKVKQVNGACSYWEYWDDEQDHVHAPLISENGATILLPGQLTEFEEGSVWLASKALLNRSRLVELGGRSPSMTHDGRTISLMGESQPAGVVADVPALPVTWYDLATGVGTASVPGCTPLSMTNASRHGRYFVAFRFGSGEGCERGGPLAVPGLSITDRTLGVTYDLGAALAGSGFTPPQAVPGNQLWPDGSYATPQPVLTGDGKVVFVPTEQGWVSLTWMP